MAENNIYEEFGLRIKELRKSRKLTQAELSQLFGLSKTAIVNYENGSRKVPLELIVKFAEFFEVSIDDLTGMVTDRTVLVSADERTIRVAKRWHKEFGSDALTEEEAEQLITYAKFLIYMRTEKMNASNT